MLSLYFRANLAWMLPNFVFHSHNLYKVNIFYLKQLMIVGGLRPTTTIGYFIIAIAFIFNMNIKTYFDINKEYLN